MTAASRDEQASAGRVGRTLRTLVLLLCALGLAFALAETVSRTVLNPVDYLAVHPVPDTVLGVRLEPHAGGHDAWGFRNRTVPESTEVVTIGDSQTYGVSAPATLSWPAQLGRITGRRVYNLALGGYGPVQYLELLRTRALTLRPRFVVVGLYYGNDLWDAYRTVYGLQHWRALRRHDLPTSSDTSWGAAPRNVILGSSRDWLARHSVAYRLVTYTALGAVARQLEAATQAEDDMLPFRHPTHGARTLLTPGRRLGALDLEQTRIQEGLRLSLSMLEEMNAVCRSKQVGFLVVLIPTKERVLEPWIQDGAGNTSLRRLLTSEHEANRQVRLGLRARGIRHLDAEGALRDAAGRGAVYPGNDDGHPTAAGYAAIARAVARAMEEPSEQRRGRGHKPGPAAPATVPLREAAGNR